MKKFVNDIIVITDPCYIESHSEMEADTLYGDWSCMVYPGNMQESKKYKEWSEKYKTFWKDYNFGDHTDEEKKQILDEFNKYEKEWKENEVIGEFCADSGQVGVFIWNKLSEKDQQFVRDHPWCCTVIKDFTGIIEFYDSDSETRHVIGKGNKPFFSIQSGF